ncbi:MAG: hypothetical protein AABX07_00215, partial [Nanoarchaeota archaeon]
QGLVKIFKRAGSDAIALTSLNTLPMIAIETLCAGMSLQDSANVRVAVSATNPVFGLARDLLQTKVGKVLPQLNKSPIMDVLFGIAAGATEFAVSFTKYYAIRLLNGQDFSFQDATASLLASGYASLYTMCFGGLMGTAIDTYRDGLGIERKENSRSLFPVNMNSSAKKTITYALSAAALVGLEEFYRRTR